MLSRLINKYNDIKPNLQGYWLLLGLQSNPPSIYSKTTFSLLVKLINTIVLLFLYYKYKSVNKHKTNYLNIIFFNKNVSN